MNRTFFLAGCGMAATSMVWGGPIAAVSSLLLFGGTVAIVDGVNASSTTQKIVLITGGVLAAVAAAATAMYAAPIMFGTTIPLNVAFQAYWLGNFFIALGGGITGLTLGSLITDFATQILRNE